MAAQPLAANHDAPIGEINTTPLIDVMLVLLIMFVITIPAATHSLDVDLPVDCSDCPMPDPLKNKIVIDAADTIRWNGEPVSSNQLATLLAATREMPVEPELQFEPAPAASYDASAHALGVIERSGVTKFGFVGNERFRRFGADGL